MAMGGGISYNDNPYAFYGGGGTGFGTLNPQARNVLGLPATDAVAAAGVAPAGAIQGTAPLTYNPAVGGIPSVPDPLKAVQDAISAYSKNIPALQALANVQTAANQEANLNQYIDLYPQLKPNVAQIGADVSDWSQGLVSNATTNYLAQLAAEFGQGTGIGATSPAALTNLFLKAGLTSEALQAKAADTHAKLMASLPHTTPTTIESMGMTPASIFSPLYNAQMQAALYAAAPNPADAYNLAMANLSRGLNAGGAAGRGPYAGTPTIGGTSSPEILKMLQDLMQRPFSNTPTQTAAQPSAPIQSDWYENAMGALNSEGMWGYDPLDLYISQNTPEDYYGNYGGEFDVVQPGMDFGG